MHITEEAGHAHRCMQPPQLRDRSPCLAARTLLLADFAIGLPPQCRDLCQISCKRFSPIRYRQISSAIAGTALYSRFAGHSGGAQLRGRGGRAFFPWPTKAILQGDYPGLTIRRSVSSRKPRVAAPPPLKKQTDTIPSSVRLQGGNLSGLLALPASASSSAYNCHFATLKQMLIQYN